jgi:hypothetical protein
MRFLPCQSAAENVMPNRGSVLGMLEKGVEIGSSGT